MASNIAEREIIDESFIADRKERSQQLSNAAFDVSAEEGQLVQPCTFTAKGEAPYIAAEHQPIHIENNSSMIIISARSKCNSDASESLDVSALSKELANILNIDITNNLGVVIVCENIQLNFGVQSGKTIEELKATIRCNKGVPTDQLRSILDGKQLDSSQSNKTVKDGLINRSEFCHTTGVLVPNTSQL
jgi:hypothetical protein